MTFDDDLDRAFRTLGDRLHDAIGRELAASAAVVAASARVRPDPKAAQPGSAVALRDHILTLDAATSLAAMLDALAAAAGSCAGRAVVFLARGSYEAWRLVGFDSVPDAERTALVPERAGIVGEAVRRKQTVRTTDATGLPRFAGRAAKALACPLLLGGEPVAVLYADAGAAGAGPAADVDDAALEILCSHAARKIEAHVAFMTARHVLIEATSRQMNREAQAS